MAKEPVKYEQHTTEKSGTLWVITDEWKQWDRKRKQLTPPKPKTKRVARVTEETHTLAWKTVAWYTGNTKRIFFCACMSGHGQPFQGCGAVGIQNARTSEIRMVNPPRFE